MKIPLTWLNEIIDLPRDKKSLYGSLTSVGHMLDKVEVKNKETIIDLELRGNRADCYSILGIAREISAIYGNPLKNIDLIDKLKRVKMLKNSFLQIDTPLVKRAAMIEIYNVKIEKSPKWLSEKLYNYGMESVNNNIVDLTNYVMIEMGEPMHAFDLDKLSLAGNAGKVKGGLEIRLAKNGEKITTFQGTTITLMKDDLVWSTRQTPKTILSVAGAIGEKFHSISDTTKNVLLEAANYDRANIRRTVYRHGLFTDAGIRHEKDLDPNMVTPAIGRFLYLMRKHGWGDFEEKFFDYYPNPVKPWKINLDLKYLSDFSGLIINTKEVLKIMKSLGFKILSENNKGITVKVPTNRTDVKLEEDLIEEILRINGYDKIPEKVLSLPIPKNITPEYIKQEEKVKNAAVSAGFDEIISLSFVKEDFLKLNSDTNGKTEIVTLVNPPSPDTKTMRMTLLPNLYEQAQKAVFERSQEVLLFEVGKIYGKWENKYIEKRRLGFILATADNNPFTNFKAKIFAFFNSLNMPEPKFETEENSSSLKKTYNLKIGNQVVGYGGVYDSMQYIELDLDSLIGKGVKYRVNLWPKYPPQIEDLTFLLPEHTFLGEVAETAKSISKDIIKFDLKGVYGKAYTFNVWYQNETHTLDANEVKEIRNNVVSAIQEKFKGEIK